MLQKIFKHLDVIYKEKVKEDKEHHVFHLLRVYERLKLTTDNVNLQICGLLYNSISHYNVTFEELIKLTNQEVAEFVNDKLTVFPGESVRDTFRKIKNDCDAKLIVNAILMDRMDIDNTLTITKKSIKRAKGYKRIYNYLNGK